MNMNIMIYIFTQNFLLLIKSNQRISLFDNFIDEKYTYERVYFST